MIRYLAIAAIALCPGIAAAASVQPQDRDGRYCDGAPWYTQDGGLEVVSPFFGADMAMTYYALAVWCDHHQQQHRDFWRSYYRYFGCDSSSIVGQKIEEMLVGLPISPALDDGRRFVAANPEVCHAFRATCDFPGTFDPEAGGMGRYFCQIGGPR